MYPALFLDRDGVVNVDKNYAYRVEDLELCPSFIEGFKILKSINFLSIVVSNQSGIARGMFSISNAILFNQAINSHLFFHQAPQIDHFIMCPHLLQTCPTEYSGDCFCRKPSPGMIDIATKRYPIDLNRSWLIGDRWSDIEAGFRRGLRSIQIISDRHPRVHPNAIARVHNFYDAAIIILNETI